MSLLRTWYFAITMGHRPKKRSKHVLHAFAENWEMSRLLSRREVRRLENSPIFALLTALEDLCIYGTENGSSQQITLRLYCGTTVRFQISYEISDSHLNHF